METFNISKFKNNSNIKIQKTAKNPVEAVIFQDSDRICMSEPQAIKMVQILAAIFSNAYVEAEKLPNKLLEDIGASDLVENLVDSVE